MSIKFEKNTYLSLVKKNPLLSSDNKISNYIGDDLQFEYIDVKLQDFKAEHSRKGWWGRKVIALPASIWSGVVKTIYHVTKAILVGFLVRLGDKRYLKTHIFYIARDLQESFGWLATLFDDGNGQYYVQKSGFHRSCYNRFLTKKNSQSTPLPPPPPSSSPSPAPSRSTQKFILQPKQEPFELKPKKTKPVLLKKNNPDHTGKESSLLKKQNIINIVANNPNTFLNLDYLLKNDQDVVTAALSNNTTAEQAKKVIDAAGYSVKNDNKVALAAVKIDPSLLELLGHTAKNNQEVVATALNGCKTTEQAKKVIKVASYTVKDNSKVALAAVKIDPSLFELLGYAAKNNQEVVETALKRCTTAEAAKKVIEAASYATKDSSKVALAAVKIDPSLFELLGYAVKDDEEVVKAALSGCRTAEAAKKVIDAASFSVTKNKKIALIFVKIDPSLFKKLPEDLKNDEEVVIAVLDSCKNADLVRNVIESAGIKIRSCKKVGLIALKIDPTLLKELSYDLQNDVELVKLAIEQSTEQTIHKIWSSIGVRHTFDQTIRAKVKEKYPNFFQNDSHEKPRSSRPQNQPSNRKPQPKTPPSKTWSEPDDLKNNTSEEANAARQILKQNHLLHTDLTKVEVSANKARDILCQFLNLGKDASNDELKKAYRKAILSVHPDKCKLESANAAFIAINAAYQQSGIA